MDNNINTNTSTPPSPFPTPRTDAAEKTYQVDVTPPKWDPIKARMIEGKKVVPSSLARTLERENIRLREALLKTKQIATLYDGGIVSVSIQQWEQFIGLRNAALKGEE